ncbi:histone-lysine N-methyltransferase SETDB1-like isoform X4 [Acropora palmata]|uniref:histone-lysine N-methyltransferase SETDB1-like isoform X4 n=1 Tax=Acropora palmata TaxID=6131 RepID=UPI003DA10F1E
MGEIGIMVSRLQHEGYGLEDLIDEELRAAGFLELCERNTRSLFQRAVAIEESQSSLRRLLDSIDQQIKHYQESQIRKDDKDTGKQDPKKTPVIVIEDDEVEYVDVADMSCQATSKDIENETGLQAAKEKETLQNTSERGNTSTQSHSFQSNTSKGNVSVPSTSSALVSIPRENTTPALTISKTLSLATKPSESVSKSLPTRLDTVPKPKQTTSKPSDVARSFVSTSTTTTPPVIYRTLKSPVISGAPLLPQRVALKSSPPSLPVQQSFRAAVKSSLGNGIPVVSPTDVRASAESFTVSQSSKLPQAECSSSDKHITDQEKSFIAEPPNFEVGTRVIGQRADELWYPGVIEKIMTDKTLQKKTKYKVKFDKGSRGLLSSNHIALESYPHPSVLNVGSRVVGIYGKLDVLYAGIVAENACTENKNRFLVFFDDGFAQYLPVKKLHHVFHTGTKAWDEVAEHSREFIQEYLEEFPNRPMVKLKAGQWVKTEWRGQWLKARVVQLDCSLVKMLFQIDNRSEWLYRGSTRLGPLFSALVDGKISTARKKRSRKLTRGKTTEPFIDYSITKPCLGISPYSKTDPNGEEQRKLEEKRQQTQLEQQRQHEHQEQIRDENNKMSASTVPVKTTSTSGNQANVASTLTAPTTSSTMTSATENVKTSSTGTTELSAPRSQFTGPTDNTNAGPTTGGGKETSGSVESSNSVTLNDSQPKSSCEGSSHATPPSSLGQQSTATVSKCGNVSCIGCCNCGNSSLSAIQASHARKKTNAGLVITKDHLQRSSGVEVIDLEGDGTAGLVSVSMETDHILDSLTSQKNESFTCNMDGSLLDDIYDSWEAPWLRANRRDARSTGRARVPAFQIPVNSKQKQDAASLIQERLKQREKKKPGVSEAPGYPALSSKPAIKGPHRCSKLCNSTLSISDLERVKHNPRAIPLLLKWKREIAQRHPGNKKTVYYRTPCNKRLRSFAELANYLAITEAANVTIDQFSFDPNVSCKDTVYRDVVPICPDISRNAEKIQISVVNEVDTCFPPPIDYVSKRTLAEGVNMVLDPGFLACCDCTDNCQDKSKCSCSQLTIQASASVGGKEDSTTGYEFRMLRECVQTGIYECNGNCACGPQCFNRVVQNGIQLRLQVFKTENRGWGLRCLDDIPMGTFVCTYAGQILNEDMANKEGRDFGDEYLAELDHIEVVEKAKEGYESNVSDLEEDDNVIYQTLGGDTSSSASPSENSGESSLSEEDSSEADSVLSEDSFSSEKRPKQEDCMNTNQKPQRRKKRKRSSKKCEKKARVVQGEEGERESKAEVLSSNPTDEKWCYIALKRNHDNQKEAAAFLKKMMKGEVTSKSGVQAIVDLAVVTTEEKNEKQKEAEKFKQEMDGEEKNVSQSSDFDFDEVEESFLRKMRVNALQSESGNDATNSAHETKDIKKPCKQRTDHSIEEHYVNIIDLTSEPEADTGKQNVPLETIEVQPKSNVKETPLTKLDAASTVLLREPCQPDKIQKKPGNQEANANSETVPAPSLISVEDLSKLAAKNPTVSDEPPVLTKMNPPRNSLEEMISRLKTRVFTTQKSSSAASLNEPEGPADMGFETPIADATDNCSIDKSSGKVDNSLKFSGELISDPSSPDTENIESCPPSPSSLHSDVSKTESLDRKSEVSTGSSRRSTGVSSKPPAKRLKTNKPKIHYSRSHPKASTTNPSMKASPNTPSPSRPSLSRQSSASSKRMSTRLMFGEEHCYVIDAKAYGNCGRYLNHSCTPNLFVQNVFVDTHDLRFPWVAFFTQQNVPAGTELTWDYAYEVGSVKGKVMHCYCGSAECRGRLL